MGKNTNAAGVAINWMAVRKSYVEGIRDGNHEYPKFPSIPELSEMYNISVPAIAQHCSKGMWVRDRTKFIGDLNEVTEAKHVEKLADRAVEFDNKCYNMSMSGIKDIEEKINFFKTMPVSSEESKVKETLTIDFYDKASRAIERFQRIGRIALGLSSDNNKSNPSYNNIKIISFSEGLDKVMKQIRSDPELLVKIEDDLSD